MIFGMKQQRTLKLIAAGGIAMTLQGCIAAALPIAAGGLMAGGGRVVPETQTTSEAETAAATAQASTNPSHNPNEVVETTSLAASISTVEVNSSSASDYGVILVKEDETVSNAFAEFGVEEEATASDQAVSLPEEVTTLAVLAAAETAFSVSAPGPAASVSSTASSASASNASSSVVIPVSAAPPAVAGGTFFDPLHSYASSPEFAVSGARGSATLLDPTSLEPDRNECTQGESTVLIDLDPENGELLPVNTRSASPVFAQKLADLRVRGVTIAWISENSEDKANDIRIALFQSGLDPLGADKLLLIRTPDERKQTRRDELAHNSCLIAIAGDARSDFHELFDYLLNPSDAVALEPLIGEGWFLIPTPLVAERSIP